MSKEASAPAGQPGADYEGAVPVDKLEGGREGFSIRQLPGHDRHGSSDFRAAASRDGFSKSVTQTIPDSDSATRFLLKTRAAIL